MEPQLKAPAKFAHLLPRGCRNWLDAYDVLRPEIERHDDSAKIQYITGSYEQVGEDGLLGLNKITKEFLLARVAEELLAVRPTRTTIYGMIDESYKRLGPSDELMNFLKQLVDVAPRRS